MKKTIIYLLLAMAVYLIMMVYTIPEIRSETGGIEIYDMRPGGYTVEEGYEILDNITVRGLNIYRSIQLPLDFLYPMLFCLFLYNLWITLFNKGILYNIRWITMSVMAFDYLENMGIYWILEKQSALSIRITSFMSLSKAISTSLVMTILMIGCIYKISKYLFKGSNKNARA